MVRPLGPTRELFGIGLGLHQSLDGNGPHTSLGPSSNAHEQVVRSEAFQSTTLSPGGQERRAKSERSWPYAFARVSRGRSWLVRIDPTRALPQPLAQERHTRALAHVAGPASGSHVLLARQETVGVSFVTEAMGATGTEIMRGTPAGTASTSAIGIDWDGFLVYAEGPEAMALLASAGITTALDLDAPALALDTEAGSAGPDGRPASSRAVSRSWPKRHPAPRSSGPTTSPSPTRSGATSRASAFGTSRRSRRGSFARASEGRRSRSHRALIAEHHRRAGTRVRRGPTRPTPERGISPSRPGATPLDRESRRAHAQEHFDALRSRNGAS